MSEMITPDSSLEAQVRKWFENYALLGDDGLTTKDWHTLLARIQLVEAEAALAAEVLDIAYSNMPFAGDPWEQWELAWDALYAKPEVTA